MRKNKTNEQFKEEVVKLVGDEYTVEGVYEKSSAKVGFYHNTCGNTFSMTPNNFLNGHRCPKCASHRRSKLTRQVSQ